MLVGKLCPKLYFCIHINRLISLPVFHSFQVLMEDRNYLLSSLILVLNIFNRKRFGLPFLAHLVVVEKKDSIPYFLWAISQTPTPIPERHMALSVLIPCYGLEEPSRAL